MDLVHIDYVKMEVTVGMKQKPVVKDVLVVEDHFTHYIQAYVTKNHTTRTTARVLYNEYFSVFGFPRLTYVRPSPRVLREGDSCNVRPPGSL